VPRDAIFLNLAPYVGGVGGNRIGKVLLSDIADEQAVASALKAGADDYILTPIQVPELLARISVQTRRRSAYDAETLLKIGYHRFYPGLKVSVSPCQQKIIHLNLHEATLLKIMCLAEGRTVNRSDLSRDSLIGQQNGFAF